MEAADRSDAGHPRHCPVEVADRRHDDTGHRAWRCDRAVDSEEIRSHHRTDRRPARPEAHRPRSHPIGGCVRRHAGHRRKPAADAHLRHRSRTRSWTSSISSTIRSSTGKVPAASASCRSSGRYCRAMTGRVQPTRSPPRAGRRQSGREPFGRARRQDLRHLRRRHHAKWREVGAHRQHDDGCLPADIRPDTSRTPPDARPTN